MTRIIADISYNSSMQERSSTKDFFLSKTTVKSDFISSKNIYSNKNEIKIFSHEGKL